MQETWVWSSGQEDPLEKEMATHTSILAWEMDRGAWWAIGHGVAKSWTRLSNSAWAWTWWLINNVVIVSDGQQRDSAIHIPVFILPQTSLPSRLHGHEQSSLGYSRTLWGIHFKYSSVYMSIPNFLTVPSPCLSSLATISPFSKSADSLFIEQKSVRLGLHFYLVLKVLILSWTQLDRMLETALWSVWFPILSSKVRASGLVLVSACL